MAQVIYHRLASGRHGATICGVIYEGANQTFCQFTFACDGSLDRPKWRTPGAPPRCLSGADR